MSSCYSKKLGVDQKPSSISFHSDGSHQWHGVDYIVHIVFDGVHFTDIKQILFDRMRINYLDLEEWASPNYQLKSVNLELLPKFDPRPTEVSAQFENFRIAIKHQFRAKTQDTSVIITRTTFVEVEPITPLNFHKYLDVFHRMQIFLSLCMGRATSPIFVEGFIKSIDWPISIFYASLPIISKKLKRLRSNEMLLTIEDLDDDVETYLRNWFEKAEFLEPIYNLYGSILFRDDMFTEQRFLTYSQAIEAYHRRSFEEKIVSGEVFSEIYEILVSALPEDIDATLKQRIKGSLQYTNELSLRSRLKALWYSHEKVLLNIFPDKREFVRFINDVINTRNHLTHYDEKSEKQAKTDSDSLFKMSNRLRFLIEICLLWELGLSHDKILDIVSRHLRYKYY